MTENIRLIIGCEYALYREAISRVLASERDIEIVAEASNPTEVKRAIRQTEADLLLLDMDMTEFNAPEVLSLIRKKNPDLSEEEVERHYQTVHTELARNAFRNIPGFRKYVQNKVLSHTVYNFNQWGKAELAEPEFDRFVELYFDDVETLAKSFETPEMKACFDDHKNFMDINRPANIKVYEVGELVPLKREEYTGQLCKGFTLADEDHF